MAQSRKAAGEVLTQFLRTYEAECPKVVECLASSKDREVLLSFSGFLSSIGRLSGRRPDRIDVRHHPAPDG